LNGAPGGTLAVAMAALTEHDLTRARIVFRAK
jgi:translation initiation factor IF-1